MLSPRHSSSLVDCEPSHLQGAYMRDSLVRRVLSLLSFQSLRSVRGAASTATASRTHESAHRKLGGHSMQQTRLDAAITRCRHVRASPNAIKLLFCSTHLKVIASTLTNFAHHS